MVFRKFESPTTVEPNQITSGSGDEPPQHYEQNAVDRILADELLRLSFHERNNISEEIHGVRDAYPEFKENSEAVELALSEMEREIESSVSILSHDNNNNSNNSSSSSMAHRGIRLEHIPKGVEFRMAFLRSELFDAKKAAKRLLTCVRVIRESCACKKGISGCSCQNIGDTQQNGGRIKASEWFTDVEYRALKTGAIQLAPFRDRSGRLVLIAFSSCFRMKLSTRMKIVLYILTGASEDVETQKRGFVVLVWPGTTESPIFSNGIRFPAASDRTTIGDYQLSLPLRIVCIHFGFERSPVMNLVLNMMVMMFRWRTRINIITGTPTELSYKIMGFGINPATIPIDGNGVVKTKNFLLWIGAHEKIEREPYGSSKLNRTTGAVVECPGVNDVLFQRGKFCQYHPGNITFRGMLESKQDEHRSANQTAKNNIAWDLVEQVEKRSGRFLHWDKSGWWMEYEKRSEIRRKVATSLRDFNKKARADANRQNVQSSTHSFRDPEQRKRKRVSPDHNYLSDYSCNDIMPCL